MSQNNTSLHDFLFAGTRFVSSAAPRVNEGTNMPALDAFEGRLDRLFKEAEAEADAPQGESELDWVDANEDDLAPTVEFVRTTHRISAQFIKVMSTAASQLLSGRNQSAALMQMQAALDALEQLAQVASDARHAKLVADMRTHTDQYRTRRENGKGHQRFRDKLRDWLPDYATYIGGDSGGSLLRVTEFSEDDVPVFRELLNLRGMGPRRLRRLYAAGLNSTEILANGEAKEVAQVTGLPEDLAKRAIEAASSFKARDVERLVFRLSGDLAKFERLIARGAIKSEEQLKAVARSIEFMRRIVQTQRTTP